MPTCQVNGTELHYLERGKGQPAVVLLHGFPLDARMWEAQIEALSGTYRVIAPDLRGFGQSRSSDAVTMESLADDVHALAATLGICPYVLGGLSMGGYIALRYDRKYPTDLIGLMLIDTRSAADDAEGKRGRDRMIELVRQSGSAAVAEQMLPKMLAADTIDHRPQLVRRMRQMMESCPPLTIEHALAAMRQRDDEVEYLPSIGDPTLIIVGDADVLTPPDVARRMQQQIPRAQLAVIRGGGHMSPIEQPGQVNRAMRSFLDGLQQPS